MILNIGDHVAYSVQFLRAIGASHSDMSHARGHVTRITAFGERRIIEIDWGDDNIPKKVIEDNLAIVGPNTRFCQC